MKKLYFKVENREQRNAIEGLAYHVADVNYILERYGAKDPEHEKAHQNVLLTFKHLDALGVPFWVQNSVVCFAENWRQYTNRSRITAVCKPAEKNRFYTDARRIA